MSNELHTYDAGLLSDFGGGNVEWWQDYIRAELGRAHDFYEAQIASYTPPAASGQQEDLSAAILRIPCAAPDDIKGKGIFVYHYENGLRDGLRKAAELAAAHTEPAQQERATMGDCAKCKAIGAAYKIGSESASAPAEQARDAEIEALIAALKDCARHPRKSQRDNIVSKALAAIATESAPAAGAASIDTPEFRAAFAVWTGHMDYYEDINHEVTKQSRDALIAHINAWGAQQREVGRQEVQARYDQSKRVDALCFESERKRAEKAEAALAQRAAGEEELPPLTMSVYGTREMLEQERQRRAQLAARAAGGVDLSAIKRWQATNHGMIEAPFGSYYSVVEIEAILSQNKEAAPVGDGDERAKVLDEAARLVEAIKTNVATSQIATAIRALTQQKG